MVVRRTVGLKTGSMSILPGAGAIEMELSRLLRNYAITIAGKEQLIIAAFASALEVIPRFLLFAISFYFIKDN
jgi:T-complex protein 1 subunit eta